MPSTPAPNHPEPESIFDALPSEQGGPENRRGLAFQDHVAVGFMLEMLERENLTEVWCESEDDITLIWIWDDGRTEVEFVQVKSDDPDQNWTIALLCRRKSGADRRSAEGSSIFERSLSRDRFREPCCFRIVTEIRVNRDLRHLRLSRDHRLRQQGTGPYRGFEERFPDRFKVFQSPNGNDWRYWTERVVWDVRHSTEAIRDRNLLRLELALAHCGLPLAPDHREQLYDLLVRKAYDAGMADGRERPESKRITRDQFRDTIVDAATKVRSAGTAAEESTLEMKMRLAGLEGSIGYAREARLRFLREWRTSRYFSVEQRERLEDDIGDRLQMLWAMYQDGRIDDSPTEFYTRCLAAMDEMRVVWNPDDPIPGIIPKGAMFDRVNRCVHRFSRLSLSV